MNDDTSIRKMSDKKKKAQTIIKEKHALAIKKMTPTPTPKQII